MLGRYPVAGQGKYITIEPVHFSEKTASVDADGTMVHFVLNRQYRNWPLRTCWQGDTLIVTCHDCTYRLPRHVVDHARAFCWESPQKVGAQYDAEGTFLFISRDALDSLQHTGRFVYDGITWRRVDESGQSIHVRADATASLGDALTRVGRASMCAPMEMERKCGFQQVCLCPGWLEYKAIS